MNVVVFKSKKSLNGGKSNSLVVNVNYDRESKLIIGFCVLQTHEHGELSFQIIKYDTAHGKCHVHRYYECLDHEGDLLLDNRICPASLNEFKNDIKQNWREYLGRYNRKWFRHKF